MEHHGQAISVPGPGKGSVTGEIYLNWKVNPTHLVGPLLMQGKDYVRLERKLERQVREGSGAVCGLSKGLEGTLS